MAVPRPAAAHWAGLVLAGLGFWHALLAPLPLLARLEQATEDWRQQLRSRPAAPHPDIAIVDLDEASLQTLGHWPWPRERLAALSDELLQRQQVAALGVDLVFPEPTAGDAALARAWQDRPVLTGFYLTADRGGLHSGQAPQPLFALPPPRPTGLPAWNGLAANTPTLAAAAPRGGFFNVVPDTDGLVRSVPGVAVLDGQAWPSLALSMALQAAGQPTVQPELRPAGVGRPPLLEALRLQSSSHAPQRLALDERGQWRVPYQGPGGPTGGSFRYLSASDVLAGHLPAGSLRGQLVLLGSSAPGLADLRATPVNPALPGVEIHALMLAGLLGGHLAQRPAWAPGYEAVLILLTLAAVAWAVRRRSPARALAALAGVGAAVVGQALAWQMADQVLPLASALLLGGLYAVALLTRGLLHEWQQRRTLQQLFEQYLPPARARALAAQGDTQALEASNRELTILFCDLRGFTTLSEQLPPQALREVLNRYFGTVTEIVHRHGGTLDKFIGDAAMAFWNAPTAQPDHAVRAVRAALDLAQAAGPLNAHLAAQSLPGVRFGIGLATGTVCVGDLGTPQRRTYTAVGDAVNLAARLETLTRELGVDLLVAGSTRTACGEQLDTALDWLEVDECQVKGRQQSVTVFTVLPASSPNRATQQALLRNWVLALQAARGDDPMIARAHLTALQHSLMPDTAAPSFAPAADTVPSPWGTLCARLNARLTQGTPQDTAP
ncbi:CHASE2 domain-containing protein [Ideonella oryzae]|uniref:Adenylate/guanylate cyclase domain-containing protein n=1 Tax=Ideonella oryzae TaxID=2937441 RepID=A0ABT1BPT0_9BURK|nr:adenylate/guanylate cyclase domain-containing protein [Ideonella oryzae]MCO5977576.1 adenylate/guanylate cyclase domain-containing protein [Ideonella oryzae]